MKYDGIVLAYGKGSRSKLSYNKVLYKMNDGNSILDNALKPFILDDDCQNIILVINEEDKKKVAPNQKIIYCDGGSERFYSVANALQYTKSEYVLIHDGARPYINEIDLKNIKNTLIDSACILADKVKDTVKVVKDGYIIDTLNREYIYLAKTPQAFKTDEIIYAYKKAQADNYLFTDDSAVYSTYIKKQIKVIPSNLNNNKITFLEDLENI